MTAQEFIKANVKNESQENATVLALIDSEDYKGWWHVHRNEELPKDNRVVIGFR